MQGKQRFYSSFKAECSLGRFLRYKWKCFLRFSGSPHTIALGLGLGVGLSFLPLIGIQFILVALLAWLLRANLAAALLGTLFANPLTFAIILALDYQMGLWIESLFGYVEAPPQQNIEELWANFNFYEDLELVLKPLFFGSIALALISFLVFYAITFTAVKTLKHRRKQRFSLKKKRLNRRKLYKDL